MLFEMVKYYRQKWRAWSQLDQNNANDQASRILIWPHCWQAEWFFFISSIWGYYPILTKLKVMVIIPQMYSARLKGFSLQILFSLGRYQIHVTSELIAFYLCLFTTLFFFLYLSCCTFIILCQTVKLIDPALTTSNNTTYSKTLQKMLKFWQIWLLWLK